MKKLVLLLTMFFICFSLSAQELNEKFLQGIWETEFHLVEFKTINKKKLKITIILKETNEVLEVVSYKFNNNNLYIETYYKPNDWKAVGELVIIDENTLADNVISEIPGILIYKRKLTN